MQNPLTFKFLLAPELLHISGFYCTRGCSWGTRKCPLPSTSKNWQTRGFPVKRSRGPASRNHFQGVGWALQWMWTAVHECEGGGDIAIRCFETFNCPPSHCPPLSRPLEEFAMHRRLIRRPLGSFLAILALVVRVPRHSTGEIRQSFVAFCKERKTMEGNWVSGWRGDRKRVNTEHNRRHIHIKSQDRTTPPHPTYSPTSSRDSRRFARTHKSPAPSRPYRRREISANKKWGKLKGKNIKSRTKTACSERRLFFIKIAKIS